MRLVRTWSARFVFVAAALCVLHVDAGTRKSDAKSAIGAYAARPEVEALIRELVRENEFDAKALRKLFAQVRFLPGVVAAMSRPVIAPPKWFEYAPQFLNAARVDAGVAFWRQHGESLARAQREFGVPAEVIVAIIGVETFYGRNTGSFRVIDALSTLAFDYPRRGDYFRGELKTFLVLSRSQGVSPLAPKGSFAGAAGLPQFMPGSIRDYAVDFDGDGKIDLLADPDDAIGSVANYLARHDWQAGQPVMNPVRIDAENAAAALRALDGGISERRTVAAWVRDGVLGFSIPGDIAADPVGVLMLEQDAGPQYWMVFNNWFVITRYNRSRLYASAVWGLAQAVKNALAATASQ
jgi:membrane-bound lytic murein transglycosylase B